MFGHSVPCDICIGPSRTRPLACGEEDGFDMPPPADRLCRMCRKAVKDAKEQREYLTHLYRKNRFQRV